MEDITNKVKNLSEIESFILALKFKKSMVGGIDSADVYSKIKQISEMYVAYLKNELEIRKAELEQDLDRERARSRSAEEKVQAAEDLAQSVESRAQAAEARARDYELRCQELESRCRQLEAKADHSDVMFQLEDEKRRSMDLEQRLEQMQQTNQALEEKLRKADSLLSEHVRKERELQFEVKEEKSPRMAETEISDILMEAHRAGAGIIERAKIDAEKEGIQIRAKYKKDIEEYKKIKQNLLLERDRLQTDLQNAYDELSMICNRVEDIRQNL